VPLINTAMLLSGHKDPQGMRIHEDQGEVTL
jgi:hypothetical protein